MSISPLGGSFLKSSFNFNYKRDIVEIAVDTPELSTLVTAVQVTDLVDTLQSPGPFTVFAPTNTAFANLPDGVLDELLANPDALADVYFIT